MATPPPPLSPEVLGQASPEKAKSVFAAEGVGPGNPQPGMEAVGQIKKQLEALDKWLAETLQLVMAVHPPAKAVLAPIAKAGEDLAKMTEEIAKRSGMAQGSPVVSPQQAPPNPSAGPPIPQ